MVLRPLPLFFFDGNCENVALLSLKFLNMLAARLGHMLGLLAMYASSWSSRTVFVLIDTISTIFELVSVVPSADLMIPSLLEASVVGLLTLVFLFYLISTIDSILETRQV